MLYPADAELDEIRAEAREEGRQEGVANGVVIGIAATVAAAALGAVAVKAAPHIKSKLNGLGSKLNRKPEDTAQTGRSRSRPSRMRQRSEAP